MKGGLKADMVEGYMCGGTEGTDEWRGWPDEGKRAEGEDRSV